MSEPKIPEVESMGKHGKDAAIDFTAGSLGGIACVYVGQPLDTIKVKMQTFPDVHKSMISCFRNTFVNEGIYRGLYAGTVPNLVTNVAENSTLFLFYGLCQKLMAKITGTDSVAELSTFSNATAGSLASFFSSLSICPTELIKCKLQAQHETIKLKMKEDPSKVYTKIGPWQLVKQIVRTEGPQGMFKGLTATFLREMPGYFFFFGGYEGTRYLFTKVGENKNDIGVWKTMVAGGIGGLFFWTSIYPFDVAKSRIQVSGTKDSVTRTLILILRNEEIGRAHV